MSINSLQPQVQTPSAAGPSDAYWQSAEQAARPNTTAHVSGTQSLTTQLQPAFNTSSESSQEWDVASAVIRGLFNLYNAVTAVFPTFEPKPQPVANPQPPPVVVTPTIPLPVILPEAPQPDPAPLVLTPAPQPPVSLIPPWAQIFEYTGKSEWRSGGTGQRAYLDLRPELAGRIEKIEVLSPDGTTVIATGAYEKKLADGRPRYKVDKSGNNLPPGAIIKATLKPNSEGNPGGIRYIEIPKPSRSFTW